MALCHCQIRCAVLKKRATAQKLQQMLEPEWREVFLQNLRGGAPRRCSQAGVGWATITRRPPEWAGACRGQVVAGGCSGYLGKVRSLAPAMAAGYLGKVRSLAPAAGPGYLGKVRSLAPAAGLS